MATSYRRAEHVALFVSSRTLVDVGSFFSGVVNVSREPKTYAISLLTGQRQYVDEATLALLTSLDSDSWHPETALLARFGVDEAVLVRLAESGILLCDSEDEAHARLRQSDQDLKRGYWDPYQAFGYMMSRWTDPGEDFRQKGELQGILEDFEQLVEAYGPPPPHFHDVEHGARVGLPAAEQSGSLFERLRSRNSSRIFRTDKSLPLQELSTLLFYCFGATGISEVANGYTILKKCSPSGGALHPVEAYPLILDVEGMDSGIYHYCVQTHELEFMHPLDLDEGRALATRITAGQDWFSSANMLVILTARFERNFWKYRNHSRAFRMINMDAAHLSQTFQLVGHELGLGTFVTGALIDEVIDELLGLGVYREGPMLVLGCGYPANPAVPGGANFNPYPGKRDVA